MKPILCLDLGTTTGWAIQTPDGRILSGTMNFKPQRFEGGGMRYLRFERWLEEVNNPQEPFSAVYFEEVRRHLGVDASHAYGGFMGALTSWCERRGIPYSGVPVGTIKSSLTGKGNASKYMMIDGVKAKGHNPKDDNEADAIALLYYARGMC